MSLFPMFLKLEDRECLVVGAGAIGEPKIRSLLVAGAKVRVVALEARPAVAEWARLGVIAWDARGFEPKDVDGAVLVVAATSLREVIAELDMTMRTRFAQTFEAVAIEFSQCFTRLFGGGSAELQMVRSLTCPSSRRFLSQGSIGAKWTEALSSSKPSGVCPIG